ncbi:hypothetical protein WS71_13250 [Burkholderia mayonis]|uniref:Uncharacterized protein n=1 Tax=Burkholderia mayonis TaxID=1385591 RepID=A0A1B4FXS6_9BURK|nr:hypothetical protein WS71_13250 [Burkholderia mayonis]KVE54784.1 hypothetical protein WS71_05075 [Burkholderia mayonis]
MHFCDDLLLRKTNVSTVIHSDVEFIRSNFVLIMAVKREIILDDSRANPVVVVLDQDHVPLWIVKRCRFLTKTLVSIEIKTFDWLIPACFSRSVFEADFREIKKPIWRIVTVGARRSDTLKANFLLTN